MDTIFSEGWFFGFVLIFCFGFFLVWGLFLSSSFSGERRRDQIFTGSSLAPLVSANLDRMQLLHKFSINGTFRKAPVLLRREKTLL